ncbi:MAG: hypothetical protein QXD13_02590 [Candidatus Pacearchaeota archaeon]
MKTKIGIDMDGVLMDMQEKLISFHDRNYRTNTKLANIIRYDLHEVWGITHDEFIKRVLEFYDSKEFSKIEPVEGAVLGVHELAKNFDLFVITARPTEIRNKTIHSLGKYFPGKFKDIILTDSFSLGGRGKSKSDICLERGIEIAVDDYYENARECALRGIYSILFDAPWNRQHKFLAKGIARAKNWNEVVQTAKDYILPK